MRNLAINYEVLELLRANAITFGKDINVMICDAMMAKYRGESGSRHFIQWQGLACAMQEDSEK